MQFLIDKRASPAEVEDVEDEDEQDGVQGERKFFVASYDSSRIDVTWAREIGAPVVYRLWGFIVDFAGRFVCDSLIRKISTYRTTNMRWVVDKPQRCDA